ncbi:MAG: hypothetical protein MHM6MM_001715 [Cercozoa sp. M6MM]
MLWLIWHRSALLHRLGFFAFYFGIEYGIVKSNKIGAQVAADEFRKEEMCKALGVPYGSLAAETLVWGEPIFDQHDMEEEFHKRDQDPNYFLPPRLNYLYQLRQAKKIE